MTNTYLVNVDLEQLRNRRSQLEQRDLSKEDVRQWLISYGFYPRIDGLFLAEDDVLDQLDSSEILGAQPVNEDVG